MGRRKNTLEPPQVEALVWKQVLKCEGEAVLSLSLRWPRLPEDQAGLRRIGRYYQHVFDTWKARWEVQLYRQACEALARAREHSRPFRPWEAVLDYTVTHIEGGLLSLYLDAYEYAGGAHGMTVRCADTWELSTGTPRSLRSFFPGDRHWRRQIIDNLRAQITDQLATGEFLYLDGWEEAVEKEFDPDRFYLDRDHAVVFYPLYSLAPYVEGIPIFPIPLPLPPELSEEEGSEPAAGQKIQ